MAPSVLYDKKDNFEPNSFQDITSITLCNDCTICITWSTGTRPDGKGHQIDVN